MARRECWKAVDEARRRGGPDAGLGAGIVRQRAGRAQQKGARRPLNARISSAISVTLFGRRPEPPGDAPTMPQPLARSTYEPSLVMTTIFVPVSMCGGTVVRAPLERMAGL